MDVNIEKRLIRIIQGLCSTIQPEPTGVCEKLNPFHGIRAVLFDVYGTLFVSGSGDIGVASERSSGAAIGEALAAAGLSSEKDITAGDRASDLFMQTIQTTHTDMRNQGIEFPEVDIREIWRTVLDALLDEGIVRGPLSDEAIIRLSVEYECRTNPVWPMPGLPAMLRTLRERGTRLGIVSNAQFYTPLLFPALLYGPLDQMGFSPSLCVWSHVLREAKPSVQLFQEALNVLKRDFDIAPSEVVYVGNDMLNDIFPSATAGCRTVLFAGDKRSFRLRQGEPHCAGIIPDAVITDLRQLPGLLG